LFHDRPTCARSRSRCSRPERGRPKAPFSWCRCRILVIDYRWGSIGSNETAMATTGGPRVIAYLTVTGCYRAQIVYFFRMQIGPWRPLGVGLVVGSRLYRIRHRCGSLGLPESSGSHCQAIHAFVSRSGERIGRLRPEPGRTRRRRLPTSFSDPEPPPGDLGTANREASAGAANARRGCRRPKFF